MCVCARVPLLLPVELWFTSLVSTWDVHQGFAFIIVGSKLSRAVLLTSHAQRSKVHEVITIVVDRPNFASRLRLPRCGRRKSARANTNSLETAHENDVNYIENRVATRPSHLNSLERSFHTHKSEKGRSKYTLNFKRTRGVMKRNKGDTGTTRISKVESARPKEISWSVHYWC